MTETKIREALRAVRKAPFMPWVWEKALSTVREAGRRLMVVEPEGTPGAVSVELTLVEKRGAAGWMFFFEGETLAGWEPAAVAGWILEGYRLQVWT